MIVVRGLGRGLGTGASIVVLRSGLGEPTVGLPAVGGGTCKMTIVIIIEVTICTV